MTTPKKQKWREPTDEEELTAPLVNGFTFWEAYCSAVSAVEPMGQGGMGEPLADYLDEKMPTQNEMWMLADFFRMPQLQVLPRGDHGKRKVPRRPRAEQAGKIAKAVRKEQAAWCRKHKRKRVPRAETRKMIEPKIVGTDISVEEIEALLKNKSRL